MSQPKRTSAKFKSSVEISLGKSRSRDSNLDQDANGALPRRGAYRIYNKFYKRTCIQFVPTKKDNDKCGCGLRESEHRPEALHNITSSEFVWDPITSSIWEPTDTYGQVEFTGAGPTSRAKYIRIAHDTKAAEALELILVKEWKLKLPKLLISVTGGAKSFVLHPKLKQVLRQGLLKAARTTGAWIFTGGTNTGVMKHVGEAVRGHSVASQSAMDGGEPMHLIGIATWGIVEHRETLVNNKDTVTYHMTSSVTSQGACLDNNHTHFILVDDGTNGKYGKEIAFRASLENVISKKKIIEDKSYGIPVVLLVLEGGPNTILTVLESVTRCPAVPVVIAEGSGRAADILAFAHRFVNENDGIEITEFQDIVEHRQLVEKIVQAYPECNQEQVLIIYRNVLKCVGQKRYITIFRVDEEGVDIDRAILRALLKAQHASPADQLSLALLWNRVDIAMSEIFVDNQKWQMDELESAMMEALSSDRVEFVCLLLENGVSIVHFLTKKRLLDLYGERSKVSVAFQQIIGESKLRTGFFLADINTIIDKMLGGKRQDGTSGLKETVIRLLKSSQHDIELQRFQNPYNELFLWAVLCNMQKMALFMWERGDNNLARALVGARIYMAMAYKIEGDEIRNYIYVEIIAHAQEFKNVALALLDECYRANELTAQKLLTYHLEDWCGHSCLSLAVYLNHEEFVAHVSCQSLLSEIWMGAMKILNMPSFMVILGIIVPPTILFLEFKTKRELSLLPITMVEHQYDIQSDGDFDDSCFEGDEDEEGDAMIQDKESRRLQHAQLKKRSNKYTIAARYTSLSSYNIAKQSVARKVLEFYRAPITKFWANVVAYMLFLLLFSYVILITEQSGSLIAEIVLIVFVCSLCTEEIRQIIQSDSSASDNRLKAWASSKWNICDAIAVLLFFVGMGLRFHSSTANLGHVVYSLDIMLWIIRLLDIFSVSKNLGPYVVMIGRMTVDMLYFLIIMMVFLLAYGVAQQAILFPRQEPTWNIISRIFFRPYFQTYGELFITDPLLLDNTTTEFSTPRYDDYGGTISTLILAFYLLVANILLLNLLIAIFNNTFSEVQANSNQIWKFQRYELIMEYAQRPLFVPPLIILNHLIAVVICIWNKICCCRSDDSQPESQPDNRLKLFLEKHELEELLTFEEHCLYSYLHHKDTLFNATSEERVRVIGNRIELITTQLEEMAKDSTTRDVMKTKTMTTMNGRLKSLERNTKSVIHMLSTRYGMSPTRYGKEFESGATDEDPNEFGRGIRKVKQSSDIISHFKAIARSPTLRQGLKQVAEVPEGLPDDSPSPPSLKRRRGSGESPPTSPTASADEESKASRARALFSDLATRHSKRARDALEGMPAVHLKARRTPYPMSNVERYPLTDSQVDWKAIVLGYEPPKYTADTILRSNADPDLLSILSGEAKLSFNAVDGNINRQSYTGHYDVIQGLPRNPVGRTGLVGCGLLDHWGPNHTTCHIITRWRRSRDGDIEKRDKHPVLEFIVIKSRDSQEWKLPENKLSLDKTLTKGFLDELSTNILLTIERHSSMTEHEMKAQLDKLLQEYGMEVFHDYVDDERNTDNAWMETMVTNYHDETGEILGDLKFMFRDGKQNMAWLVASCQLNLPENQVLFLRRVAKFHKAFF